MCNTFRHYVKQTNRSGERLKSQSIGGRHRQISGPLWVPGQPDMHVEFQDSKGYVERPSRKKKWNKVLWLTGTYVSILKTLFTGFHFVWSSLWYLYLSLSTGISGMSHHTQPVGSFDTGKMEGGIFYFLYIILLYLWLYEYIIVKLFLCYMMFTLRYLWIVI